MFCANLFINNCGTIGLLIITTLKTTGFCNQYEIKKFTRRMVDQSKWASFELILV